MKLLSLVVLSFSLTLSCFAEAASRGGGSFGGGRIGGGSRVGSGSRIGSGSSNRSSTPYRPPSSSYNKPSYSAPRPSTGFGFSGNRNRNVNESPRVKSLLPNWTKGKTGLTRTTPKPSPYLNRNSNYGRMNMLGQPSSSQMSSSNWFTYMMIYSMFMNSSHHSHATTATASDVVQRQDPNAPKFNAENEQPGSEEINELPGGVSMTLRLLNNPEALDAFDLQIFPYKQEDVDAAIAAGKQAAQGQILELEAMQVRVDQERQLADNERYRLESEIQELKVAQSKEWSQLSTWGSLVEWFSGSIEARQKHELEVLEDQRRAIFFGAPSSTQLKYKKEKLIEDIQEKVFKDLKPYWRVSADKNLGCKVNETAAEFAPLYLKDKIMPFGVRNTAASRDQFDFDGYVVKACVDQRQLPTRVFAIKNLEWGEAYVSDVIFKDESAEPSVLSNQIQKLRLNPSVGLTGEKLEERRLESINGEDKLVYEFKMRNGQTVTLEQKILGQMN